MTLASFTVTATLEPRRWRFDGTFGFSILSSNQTVPFHERFGEVPARPRPAPPRFGEALQAELANPDNVTVE